MKKSKGKKFSLKKSLKSFMKDESGHMTKENILKIGMGTIGALSMFSGTAMSQVVGVPPSCNGQVTHLSDNTVQWMGPQQGQKYMFPSHTHHAAHCSY